MNTDLRERALLPILIPLVAIVLTEIVVFSMSRVLLAAGEKMAVIIALGAALAIMIGAAFIAARPRLKSGAIYGLLTLLLIAAVASGALAIKQGPAYLKEEAANRPQLDVSAKNIAFSTKTLDLGPTGSVIHFENQDTQPHNIAIFESHEKLDAPLFRGSIVNAGAHAEYEVGALQPGELYFHCDVHPNMSGKVMVEEEAAGGSEEHGGHEG
jgi:plastocyanin